MSSLPMPEKVPQPGYYYHYKHDANGPINGYAYELIGVGFHTESDVPKGDEHFVVYRSLYKDDMQEASRKMGVLYFYNRPLHMWMEPVTKEGLTFSRFQKITDEDVIKQLDAIKGEMYGTQ